MFTIIFEEFRGGVGEGSLGDFQPTESVGHSIDSDFFFAEFLWSTGAESSAT